MVIDFHTHIFPDSIAPKALHTLTQNIRTADTRFDAGAPYTMATADSLLASSRDAGLDISVVMPIATSPHPSATLNAFAAEVDKLPGLRSFGSVHPDNPQAMQELEHIRELGLVGIKLHPEYQSCYVDEPATVTVVRKAAALGLWVLFHAGEDIGLPPPVHGTPARFARLREAAPDARIILAHMGSYGLWKDVERLLPGMGLYIDTSFSLTDSPPSSGTTQVQAAWEPFVRIVRAMGTDHVLFGSDSPWSDQRRALHTLRDFLRFGQFNEQESQAILGGNAAGILQTAPACHCEKGGCQ